MTPNEWNNYTALGYLKHTIELNNQAAGDADHEDCRVITDVDAKYLIGFMKRAFDELTLAQAFEKG